MQKRFTLLFLLFVLFVFGCSKEALLIRKENKLEGQWKFKKVFYKADRSLFRENITRDYRDDLIDFLDDFSAIYEDFSQNEIHFGNWEILLDRDTNFNGDDYDSDIEFFLDVCFEPGLDVDLCIFGSIAKLTRNKLTITAESRRGSFTYKLERQ